MHLVSHSNKEEEIMGQVKSYKEDSTKGRARILPVSYKGDALVQAWIDTRKLLVLDRWLNKGGYVTRFLSDLIKFTIDEVVEQLVSAGIEQKVEFTKDARELLIGKYRCALNPSGRGKRNLLHNTHMDEIRKDNAWKDEKGKVPASSSEEAKSRDTAAKWKEEYDRLEKEGFPSDKKREVEGHEEFIEEYKKKHKFDEDGVIIMPGNSREENIAKGEARAAEIAKDNEAEALAKVKAKEERKAKKAKKKEEAELEAMRIEYEKKKKAFDKANDKGSAYKPMSEEEAANELDEIAKRDKELAERVF